MTLEAGPGRSLIGTCTLTAQPVYTRYVMTQRYGNEEKCPPIQDTTEFDSKHYRWRSGDVTVQMTADAFGRAPAVTVETELGDWKCSESLGIPVTY